jgi:hypothetical protein
MAHLRTGSAREVRNSFDIKATGANFPVSRSTSWSRHGEYYYDAEKKRRADVYVFAVYAERDRPDWIL